MLIRSCWKISCVGFVSIFVLVNGSSEGFFNRSRWLRQGDPLSLYLFIMLVEALSKMIQKAENAFISWFGVGR